MRSYLAFLLFLPLFNTLASVVIEAGGELAADTLDANGNTIGGIGSGVVYDAANDVYLMISDRGAGDGTLPYRPRIAVVKIAEDGKTLVPKVEETIILKDEKGRAMTGLIPDNPEANVPMMVDGRTCIDPEALAPAKDGRLFVSDEYGPFLYEFRRDGTMVRRIALPAEFEPREASGKLNYTDKAELVSGRGINQGPEGMCLLPDEKHAALIFQSATVQDGGKAAGQTKILILELVTGNPVAMYRYHMSPEAAGVKPKKISVNDLIALDSGRFLVLERDGSGRGGGKKDKTAAYKAVWLADTGGATNLLDEGNSGPEVPVAKTLLFNLTSLVEAPASLSAKWEGIAVIPPSDDKSLTLMMTSDNDFLTPIVHEEGQQHPFPRAGEVVPTQFFKIRAPLPLP